MTNNLLKKLGFRFVTCKDAGHLTDLALDESLSFRQRLGLGIHRLICAPCRYYRRQVEAMRAAAPGVPSATDSAALDSDARARIRARLRAAREDGLQ